MVGLQITFEYSQIVIILHQLLGVTSKRRNREMPNSRNRRTEITRQSVSQSSRLFQQSTNPTVVFVFGTKLIKQQIFQQHEKTKQYNNRSKKNKELSS
jgi:hypothetical protein